MDDIHKLGRYDIIRVLGKGAMGVVYEGRDPNLDRVVAIKTIRVQNLTPEAAREYEGRFRTEARSAARLNHPNIVSVFDSGQDDGVAYLVMEFIQGEDLKQHLECGARFSVRSSIVIAHELLMALDHAHRQNVVHRDIKPANLLMEVTGRVKLTDFGVARIQEADETHLTQVGGAVGTPKYMSPEQAKGLRGDSRSDVFSAAVVLYELLTGAVPFTGENQFVVIHQIVDHVPSPPSSLNSEVPRAMDDVLARAMAKNPDERYASAREFAVALRTVAQQMNTSTGTQGADVGAELGKFLASLPAAPITALGDGSSTGIFGPGVNAALNTTVNHEAELGAWNVVRDSSSPQDFLDFLERFPAGIYARRAQKRVYELGAGDALHDAKTEPGYRPPLGNSGFESTVGTSASTGPLQDPERTLPALNVADAVPADAVSEGVLAKGGRTWRLIAMAALLGTGLVVALTYKAGSSPQTQASAPLGSDVKLADTVSESAAPAVPGSAAQSASTPVVGTPARQASAAQPAASRAASKPKVSPASSAPSPVQPSPGVQADSERAVSREVTSPVTAPAQNSGQGPSMPGQACVDKVFVFKIACIAEQCVTDRYRHTAECLRFKEMEREREEQRSRR
jgi:serine/threonine-protein kinase